jgi:hypothetical protein
MSHDGVRIKIGSVKPGFSSQLHIPPPSISFHVTIGRRSVVHFVVRSRSVVHERRISFGRSLTVGPVVDGLDVCR